MKQTFNDYFLYIALSTTVVELETKMTFQVFLKALFAIDCKTGSFNRLFRGI